MHTGFVVRVKSTDRYGRVIGFSDKNPEAAFLKSGEETFAAIKGDLEVINAHKGDYGTGATVLFLVLFVLSAVAAAAFGYDMDHGHGYGVFMSSAVGVIVWGSLVGGVSNWWRAHF
jgi:hypothetical protein